MRIVQVSVPFLVKLLFFSYGFITWLFWQIQLFFFYTVLLQREFTSRLVQTRNLLIETHARYSRAMPGSAQQKYSNFAGIKFEVCL